MAPALCGSAVPSKRNLLALGWTIVNILSFLSCLITFIFLVLSNNFNDNYYYNQDNNQKENEREEERSMAISSRAMLFVAIWTIVLSGILGIFGSIILGFQLPFGAYYWCCSAHVHTTTPLALGIFIGICSMFANLTLVFAALFGEFEIHDYVEGEGGLEEQWMNNNVITKSSAVFSFLCIFLTVLYAGFAGITFFYSKDLLEENKADTRVEALMPSESVDNPWYIGNDRFGIPEVVSSNYLPEKK